MQYTGVGKRAAATIVDTIICFFGIGYAVALATGGVNEEGFGFEVTGLPALLVFFLWFAYYVVMEATVGATVGKLILGLRVVKSDDSSLDWQASIIRNILRIADGFCFYLLGAILAWNSPLKQRLGDRAAGTVVVSK